VIADPGAQRGQQVGGRVEAAQCRDVVQRPRRQRAGGERDQPGQSTRRVAREETTEQRNGQCDGRTLDHAGDDGEHEEGAQQVRASGLEQCRQPVQERGHRGSRAEVCWAFHSAAYRPPAASNCW
jgi:hypothetical protein